MVLVTGATLGTGEEVVGTEALGVGVVGREALFELELLDRKNSGNRKCIMESDFSLCFFEVELGVEGRLGIERITYKEIQYHVF